MATTSIQVRQTTCDGCNVEDECSFHARIGLWLCTDCEGEQESARRHDERYPSRECEGHPAGPFDPMGVTVYCDGTCS